MTRSSWRFSLHKPAFCGLALAAALPILASAGAARAQPAAPVMVGAEVRDAKGKAVGRIERIVAGPGGQPVQVMVRVDRILRTLPVDALRPSDKDYVSVLSRAEIASLPPSE